MPRKFFRRISPSVDKVRDMRALSLFGDALFHPALWSINRRTAAGGVAVGLFCGLIPGPLQMLGAGIAAVVFRVNLPIALVATLYTNPLTIVPLYLVAFTIGRWALGGKDEYPVTPPPDWQWVNPLGSAQGLGQWMIDLGPPLALGVLLLATLLSALGYALVRVIWSLYLRRAWHRRAARRHARG